ncbi:hypothetical protein C8Q78DRAFT_207747 [Trametes maxima]|nr:hypothetical protein C8Q78DRAFT_207747 [Trametes maxima]
MNYEARYCTSRHRSMQYEDKRIDRSRRRPRDVEHRAYPSPAPRDLAAACRTILHTHIQPHPNSRGNRILPPHRLTSRRVVYAWTGPSENMNNDGTGALPPPLLLPRASSLPPAHPPRARHDEEGGKLQPGYNFRRPPRPYRAHTADARRRGHPRIRAPATQLTSSDPSYRPSLVHVCAVCGRSCCATSTDLLAVRGRIRCSR